MSRVADAVGEASPFATAPTIAVTAAPTRTASRGHARAAHPTRTARAVPPTRLAQTSRPADEAMDRFAAGDAAAFAEMYAAVLPHLVRALGRLTRQRAAAEDLAQEAMLRIYGARATWRPGSRVLPWAQAIARRLFIDRVRRHRREQRAHDVLAHDEPAWSGARADVHLETRRKAAALAAMVERLPPRQREVLQLVCLDGKSLAEASAELGESNVAVRVRVHRARCALEAALAGH
jgi:RNA polymerase sigma-70 factor (ECF subfamily)